MWRRAILLGAVLLVLLGSCSRAAGPAGGGHRGLFPGAVANSDHTESYIAVFDAETGQVRRVGSGNRDWSPVMAPGQSRLYFLHEQPDGSVDVREAGLDGSGERTLASGTAGWQYMDLVAEGSYLYLSDGSGLWLLDLQSGAVSSVAETGVKVAATSPDGRALLYTCTTPGLEGIYRLTLPHGQPARIWRGLPPLAAPMWIGPDLVAMDDTTGTGLVLQADGVELARLNGGPRVASPQGDWVATNVNMTTLVSGPAGWDSPMMSLPNAFPMTASPEGDYLLYIVEPPNGEPYLYVWTPRSGADLAGTQLLKLGKGFEVIGWSGEDAVLIRSADRYYWVDVTDRRATELAGLPAGFSARGARPAPTPDLANLRTQRFVLWEQQSIATIERVLGSPDTLLFTADRLRSDLAINGLQVTDLPGERIRIWQMGPYPDPAGGRTQRPPHVWLQWWEPGQAPRYAALDANLYTAFRAVRQGDARLIIGVGSPLQQPGAGLVSAWRLETAGEPQPSREWLLQLPNRMGTTQVTQVPGGITMVGPTPPQRNGERTVRFVGDESLDLQVCDWRSDCVQLTWGERGYSFTPAR